MRRYNVKTVADLGCNSLKLFSLIKTAPGVTFIAGVDLDKELLEEYKYLAAAPVCRWLEVEIYYSQVKTLIKLS